MSPPTADDFRKIGFTQAAIRFPLLAGAQEIIAICNGTTPSDMPQAWCYAPNAYMQKWYEWLAAERSAERPWLVEGDRLRRMPAKYGK